jgi:2-isopropylmalate synthase
VSEDPPPTKSKPTGAADLRSWTLSRIDIRSPVSPTAWPVARVELVHAERGRVTDVASAPGAFDADFTAASHVLGISPKLLSYNVSSLGIDGQGSLSIRVDIELTENGNRHVASSCGVDLVRCSLTAWLEAACKALQG